MPAQGRRVLTLARKPSTAANPRASCSKRGTAAQIVSPCDGWIVYAGEFRSYGQLLIINAGGGYHILLAGLSQIDVQLGQFVLAGEPVGVMSAAAQDRRRQDAGQCPGPLYRIPQGPAAHRSRPLVGRSLAKGARMTRKSDYAFWTFVMLACLAGATTVLNVTRTYSATSTNSEIYKQLDLFGDVLERVRADYVEKPDDAHADRLGDQRHAGRARSALRLPQPEELPRHAGADARRVRRPRHRGHDGERRRQGGLAHRRYAGGQGRPADQRPHHASRRRADRRPDARAGGREDARPGQHADHADHRAQGQGRSVRRQDRARRDPHQRGQGARRKATSSTSRSRPSTSRRTPTW